MPGRVRSCHVTSGQSQLTAKAKLWSHLVSTENNGNVLTDPLHVAIPSGHIFESDTRGNVKHDDGGLSLDAEGDGVRRSQNDEDMIVEKEEEKAGA